MTNYRYEIKVYNEKPTPLQLLEFEQLCKESEELKQKVIGASTVLHLPDELYNPLKHLIEEYQGRIYKEIPPSPL